MCASCRSRSRAATATPIWCAREFTGRDPFLHLVGDHLYVPGDGAAPPDRLLELAAGRGVLRLRRCSPPAKACCRTSAPSAAAASPGAQRALSRRDRHRKADAHRSRAEPDRPGHPRRLLPLLLRHARPHARRHGHPRQPARPRPTAASRSPPRWPNWRATSSTSRSKSRAAATTSARATACSSRSSRSRSNGRDRAEVLAQLVELLADRSRWRTAAGRSGQ